AEKAAIASAVPEALTVEVPGRVVRIRRDLRHYLLPAIDAVQSAVGWVSPGAVDEIARRLQGPPAEVYGVASFYAVVPPEPGPRTVAHVCEDVACGPDLAAARGDRDDVAESPCRGQRDRRPAVFLLRAGTDDVVLANATPDAVLAAHDGDVGEDTPG